MINMKKIILFALLIVGITSCDLDINQNPSYPGDVEPTLIFPAAQNAIAVTVGDAMYNYAGFFAQYYDQMPEANQYNYLVQYDFDESDEFFNRSYRNLYSGALMDLKTVVEKSTNTADIFAATVLRAFAFQLMVDNLDKAPYSEALQGSANLSPKWEDGQDVYRGILAELDQAEAALDGELMSINDLVGNKNINKWQGFANALRLRIYLRFIDANIDASAYTAKAVELVNSGNFFTGDVTFDAYSNETDKRNPWYNTNYIELAMNHVAGYPIITYLSATNDPRIAFNFEKAANSGEYAGELPGSKADLTSMKNADYSALKYYATKPVYFFTQSQLQFLIAEVALRFMGDDAKAKAAYEAGIAADFAARGMAESPEVMYGAGGNVAWSTATTTEKKLELIYMQKWVALCYMDRMEAWSEIRRTDVPKLSSASARAIYNDPTIYTAGERIAPMRNGFGGDMVKRMPYPSTARRQNPTTTPTVAKATESVWWDVK